MSLRSAPHFPTKGIQMEARTSTQGAPKTTTPLHFQVSQGDEGATGRDAMVAANTRLSLVAGGGAWRQMRPLILEDTDVRLSSRMDPCK